MPQDLQDLFNMNVEGKGEKKDTKDPYFDGVAMNTSSRESEL